jgi:O-methyltransferase
MFKSLKRGAVGLANRFGYDVIRRVPPFPDDEREIMAKVRPFTMTDDAALSGLIHATRYITRNRIEGDIVECGVWRGGSMMAAAYTLLALGDTTRSLHLFDTYEGMSAPTERDIDPRGRQAQALLQADQSNKSTDIWAYASFADVRQNMHATGYPQERIHYVQGKVEDTLPQQMPTKIALLRLDTDWYESTAHELKHLYPNLSPNAVLILDDYGYWAGARQATDEYFSKLDFKPFLHRLNHPARLLIKPA